jgi:5-formyltetrahydrofolate cyclo-ligase
MAAKATLRKLIKKRLLELDPNYTQDMSVKCLNRLRNSVFYRESSALCCYLSMPIEIQTDSFISAAFNDGKRVFVPKVVGKRNSDMEIHEGMCETIS